MELIFIVTAVVILVVQSIALFVIVRRGNGNGKEQGTSDSMLLLQQQVQDMARMLDARVSESSKQVHESVRAQLSESSRLVREVTEGLTKLDETNRQVVTFADQLQNLQDILKNPKQRGILGEYYLETVLKNVLPPGSYQMQYTFPNGDIVDAVVFVKEKIIPIDSKFSLENYNRAIEARTPEDRERFEKAFKQDTKLRIDETSKYVQPEDGALEFAFMFIPSEGVYYDLLVNEVGAIKTNTRDLIEYAFAKKVIIVSPTSFHAYLQTVLQGLKALQVEEQAEEIKKRVGELGKHIATYEVYYKKLGTAVGTVVSHFNAGNKELGKIDKDVYRITGEKIGIEPMVLEKPNEDID